MWRPDVARRRPIGEILENKKPAAKSFARARHSLDDVAMPVICPTGQIVLPLCPVIMPSGLAAYGSRECAAKNRRSERRFYGLTRRKMRMFLGSAARLGCGSGPVGALSGWGEIHFPKRSLNEAERSVEGMTSRGTNGTANIRFH